LNRFDTIKVEEHPGGLIRKTLEVNMKQLFEIGDHLGPLKVIHINVPSIDLKAVVATDNVVCGPAIGGVRMAPDVSAIEAVRLARAMTLKNSAAGLAHGGGKSVIYGDPKMDSHQKEKIIRGFACAIRDLKEYIPGPDMGTDEMCMAWTQDEIGRAVGLPASIGGIPLDEIGATGFGLSCSIDVALDYCDLELKGARVVVQGFGSVGKHAARFLVKKGAVVIGASDSCGSIFNLQGLDVDGLIELKGKGKSVCDSTQGEVLEREAVIDMECDIWIPAARPDVLDKNNIDRLKTKMVVQGANIPLTPEAEQYLHEKGVLSIPDFIANAGGVICAAVEYYGGTERGAFQTIKEKITRNTRAVLEESKNNNLVPREAAVAHAVKRVEEGMTTRRWSLF